MSKTHGVLSPFDCSQPCGSWDEPSRFETLAGGRAPPEGGRTVSINRGGCRPRFMTSLRARQLLPRRHETFSHCTIGRRWRRQSPKAAFFLAVPTSDLGKAFPAIAEPNWARAISGGCAEEHPASTIAADGRHINICHRRLCCTVVGHCCYEAIAESGFHAFTARSQNVR